MEAAETSITLKVDGERYTFYPERVTAKIARLVRQASGMSIAQASVGFSESPDIDALAVIVYAAALQAGRDVSFTEIEENITYGSALEVETSEEVDDPEA